jgi:hypothetical protein
MLLMRVPRPPSNVHLRLRTAIDHCVYPIQPFIVPRFKGTVCTPAHVRRALGNYVTVAAWHCRVVLANVRVLIHGDCYRRSIAAVLGRRDVDALAIRASNPLYKLLELFQRQRAAE